MAPHRNDFPIAARQQIVIVQAMPPEPRFPIPRPAQLPARITPCPIVEAILEIRFVTSESWRTMPGLLYGAVRERYKEQRDLPLAQVPEEMRRQDAVLSYQPVIQFIGAGFIIQFGPRVVSLATKQDIYPGWPAIEQEMTWLLDRIKEIEFISEGERLGVRYINFLTENVFHNLILKVSAGERQLTENDTSVTTMLRDNPLTGRLKVSNNVILGAEPKIRKGSIIDVDVWLGALDFDLFSNGLSKFGEAHRFEKEIFFGLLKPEFLASLSPEYV